MKEVSFTDFLGLRAWASRWLEYQEAYYLPEQAVQIDFFGGKGDDAYLVIDVFQGKTSCVEYSFLAAEECDEGISMPLLFEFLRQLDFSLEKLLQWLAQASFTVHELGEHIVANGLSIERRTIQFNARAGQQEEE